MYIISFMLKMSTIKYLQTSVSKLHLDSELNIRYIKIAIVVALLIGTFTSSVEH